MSYFDIDINIELINNYFDRILHKNYELAAKLQLDILWLYRTHKII